MARRRVLRLMREHDLLALSRAGVPRGPRSHDGTIIPAAIDTIWGTDLTTTITGEGQAAVFIAADHFTAECVGIHAARQATRFEALEPVRLNKRDPARRSAAPVDVPVGKVVMVISINRLKAASPYFAPHVEALAPNTLMRPRPRKGP